MSIVSWITTELRETNFGIIVLTKDNLEAPWLYFEAGALSKLEKSKVCTLFLDLKYSDVQSGNPLTSFQNAVFTEAEIEKLVISINNVLGERGLPKEALKRSFGKWWPDLKRDLDILVEESQKKSSTIKSKDSAPNKDEILEELLSHARRQSNLLNSPSSLFPPEFFMNDRKGLNIEPEAIYDLSRAYKIAISEISSLFETVPPSSEHEDKKAIINSQLDIINSVANYLQRRVSLDKKYRNKVVHFSEQE